MPYLPHQASHLPTLEQLNRATHRVPLRNQRKARKSRRQRHAAGDRSAFQ
jgi:hypothetical protein